MTERDELNDDLSDLLSGNLEPRPAATPPADFKPALERVFEENCAKCGGSGRFRGWSGRAVGDCFACNGTGKKTFKNPAPVRAKARAQAADRVARKGAEISERFAEQHPEEMAWMIATAPRWPLIQSFVDALPKWGSLTDRQMRVVQNGMAHDAERAAKKVDLAKNAPTVDATKIEKAFATAVEKAQRKGQKGVFKKPLRLRAVNEVDVSFQPGSAGSEWEGMLFAKSGDKKLGYIKGGKFIARFDCSAIEQAAVLDCAANPEITAVAFGKAWSCCGVCGLLLTNDESIARGIGPICAEKFGW